MANPVSQPAPLINPKQTTACVSGEICLHPIGNDGFCLVALLLAVNAVLLQI